MTIAQELKYALRVKQSRDITSLKDLEAFDRHFRSEVEKESKNFWQGWFFYNEFRIANSGRLPKTRPHILTAGPLDVSYPYHYIKPLFALADVVAINCHPNPLVCNSFLPCQPATLFLDILKRLPEGFKPDFYWDNQVEHLHYIPPGLEKAPFPLVASICHTFLYKSVEYVCELFDYVLPISRYQGDILKAKYGTKILDIPFGLNWASFDAFIEPCWDKSIDVIIPFEKSSSPIYDNRRNLVLEELHKFKKKYGERYSILIISQLTQEDYIQLLRQSRIAINVTGIHGPYNYRTVETLCAGTALFQYDWEEGFFQNRFSDLFIDGVHGIGFNQQNLESKLLYFLEHKLELEAIAKAGYKYLLENYSYDRLYRSLIGMVNNNASLVFPRTHTAPNGFFQRDMIFYYQGNQKALSFMGYGLEDLEHFPAWIRNNNLMIYASVLDKTHPLYSLLLLKEKREFSYAARPTEKELYRNLYAKAIKEAPRESAWIVEWNFFLLSLELEKPTKQRALEMVERLHALAPAPFDEASVMFKYYIANRNYPRYNIFPDAINLPKDFMQMNIDLLKVSGNVQPRAEKYRDYAMGCAKYILEELCLAANG